MANFVAKAVLNNIIAAVGKAADGEGFDRLTLMAVAGFFDVRLRSLYTHVASVDGLKSSLVALSRLVARTEEVVLGRAGKVP